ncbi:hypothetical protein [Methanofollis ethanolicus]|uniref:hypothetical protein n=1 Tax=Methanofollis ethanolicus TaxID=488124 RepID=UPI000836C0CE|nr:hypothetical protein [Methanofollis ethanolicus]
MTEKKVFYALATVFIAVLCTVGGATLFLLPYPQAGEGLDVSFETLPSEEIPAVVDAALTPPDPPVPPDRAPDLSGAVAGDVATVRSLTDGAPRYYLVPLTRDGGAVAIARVYLRDDGGPKIGSWTLGADDLTAWRRPSLADAEDALRSAGYRDGNWTARWVEMNSEQPIGPYFWEFGKETGETVYVGYDRYDDWVRVYTTVTPKTKAGG